MKHLHVLPRLLALLAGAFMLGGALAANPAADPAEEGTDYKRVSKPFAVETGKQIEVAEFFWYRCPHCNQLQPALEEWAKKLPPDVKLRPVPTVLNPNWLPAAKTYYALSDLGALNRLHGKVFEAYHKEKLDLDDKAELLAWVKKQGLNAKRFEAAYTSFDTHKRVMKGDQAARTAGITGVPTLVVDGKYMTSISMTFTEERLFEVLDQLIERARKERGGKSVQRKPVATGK